MIARNMTLGVLAGSLVMFAVALGCGERATTPSPERTEALPASSGEQDEEEGKTEAEPSSNAMGEASLAAEPPRPEPEVGEPEGPTLGEAELGESGGLVLRRLVAATGVQGREPVGAGGSFEGGQPLYAFVDAANATDEDRQLYVTFEGPDGRSVGHVSLDVPANAPRWRTWAYTRNIDRPGTWEAIVETDDGDVIGRTRFEVR